MISEFQYVTQQKTLYKTLFYSANYFTSYFLLKLGVL